MYLCSPLYFEVFSNDYFQKKKKKNLSLDANLLLKPSTKTPFLSAPLYLPSHVLGQSFLIILNCLQGSIKILNYYPTVFFSQVPFLMRASQ